MATVATWYEEGGVGSFERPRTLNTLIVDQAGNRQVAWLEGAIWPPVGTVIELAAPYPDGDAVVIGVRLQLPPTVEHATILVDVSMPEEGKQDYIPRHFVDRPRE